MQEVRTRANIFCGIILMVLGLNLLRLAQLQLFDHDLYTVTSRESSIRAIRVQPARGGFFDRNGSMIAGVVPTYAVTVTPIGFDRAKIPLLARLLSVSDSTVTRRLHQAAVWSSFQPSVLFRDIPYPVFSRVQEQAYHLPGIGFEVGQTRRYLTRARAAHGLGYVREITRDELKSMRAIGYRPGDLVGKTGLEKRYEPYLRGAMGSEFKLVNIRGAQFASYDGGLEDIPPRSGYDLMLSIDDPLQALAESLFVNKRGAVVALDPNSGEILAMVSAPDFDPSVFTHPVSAGTWAYLTASVTKPMFNRATMMGLPPGSTFKPFMACVGLQEGVITPKSIYVDRGGYLLGNRFFRNYAGHVYGPMNVTRAIQISSNAFFLNVMAHLDVNTLKYWATQFGFGIMAPTDIAEQTPGLIPDSAYYNRTYPNGWTKGYTINLGIGQGDMVVTPLQMARYVSAIASRGMMYPPHMVRALRQPETGEILQPALPAPYRIPIDREYFDVVRGGMRLVMEAGTGRGAQVPGIPAGGKTGTAQASGGRKDHSIFIMFAPFDQPRIAIAVMVENAGFGAATAGPIASLLVEQYLKGGIAPSPDRQYLLHRALAATSQPY